MITLEALSISDLSTVYGGKDPGTPAADAADEPYDPSANAKAMDRLVQQCGPQMDAYSMARSDYDIRKFDTRAEVRMITARRALRDCAKNAGFKPPKDWME